MISRKQQLDAAIRAYNEQERDAFMHETGTRWLGHNGPTYLVGETRVKALFDDARGWHWVDGCLYAESLRPPRETGNYLLDVLGELPTPSDPDDPNRVADLWVHTDSRGQWGALMTPVATLARLLADAGLLYHAEAVRLPGDNWARTWDDYRERTDEQELAWVANGGKATAQMLRERDR
ncbi:hypothetical protein [Streptomyces sp. SPB78]|uniref:hypothetical protein n=1 Tax=Streptomyces sp. (strain SPB78) TaxID=591157 RepID=UPI0001B56EAB|nr:hypothetical protein [Streptomyces sp. SPB78]